MHQRYDGFHARSTWALGVRAGFALALSTAVVMVPCAAAQEVTLGGQLRPRYEFRDPTATGSDGFTSMRARATLSARLERNVRVFVQLQDVRLWGEEENTLTDFRADNLDLHQGYLELRSSGSERLSLRLGRQELNLGEQRLIGAVDWTQQARSFDGVRLGINGDFGSVDAFGYVLGDATAPNIQQDRSLLGLYVHIDRLGLGTLDIYGFLNQVEDIAETEQTTLGLRFAGQQSVITYRAEVSYQTGKRSGQDVAAFMLAGQIGASLAGGKAGLTLWYDYLSGDDDPSDSDIKVFDTLFATNHLFYGLADLFLNIPVHTAGLGLQDAAVKGTYAPIPELRLNADVHSFFLAKEGAFTSRHLGEEIDLTAVHRYSQNVTLVGGLSRVFAATTMTALGRTTDDQTWAYLMVNAVF